MKVMVLRDRVSKTVLTCYILNDDENVPDPVANYAASMGYEVVVHPVSVCSHTPLAFLASVEEEIDAYEND